MRKLNRSQPCAWRTNTFEEQQKYGEEIKNQLNAWGEADWYQLEAWGQIWKKDETAKVQTNEAGWAIWINHTQAITRSIECVRKNSSKQKTTFHLLDMTEIKSMLHIALQRIGRNQTKVPSSVQGVADRNMHFKCVAGPTLPTNLAQKHCISQSGTSMKSPRAAYTLAASTVKKD